MTSRSALAGISLRLRHRRLLCFALGIVSLTITLTISPAKAALQASTAPIAIQAAAPQNWLEQGRHLYRAGRFAEAIAAWQTAVQHYRRIGDPANEALSLSYLSSVQQELNQWQAAQASIEQSLRLLKSMQPAPSAILWAQALNTQAALLLQTGKAQTALETWQQAQNYYEQAEDSLGSLGAQINQAQALQSLGFYRRSRQQLEAIHQTLATMPDAEIEVSALRSLGAALQTIGDTSKAQVLLKQSLDLARKVGATTEISATLLNLGQTSITLGDPETALDYFEQAEKAAANSLDRTTAQLSQLKLFVDHDLIDRATPFAPQLLQSLLSLPASRASMYSAIQFVATLNQLEKPEKLVPFKALSDLMAATVRSAQQVQDPQAEAYALLQWGQLYARTEQWTEAEALMQRSRLIARQLNADDIIAQSAWKLGRLAIAQQASGIEQNKRTKAIANYTEAVKSLQSLRGDLVAVNSEIQFSFRESVEPVYRELVGLLLDDQPTQAALIQARELIEALQIAEMDNFFREACLDKTQQIDQIDSTATVIYPIILPDRLAVILSAAGQPLRYHSTILAQAQVEETLDAMLSAINPVSDSKSRLQLSQKIYDWLIRPAEATLLDTKTLVFVLDGKLRNIPMSALHDGKQYLIEKYAVSLSPGLQLMAGRSLNPTRISAIVGGISQSRSGFSALPAVETEVKEISKTIHSPVLLNQTFTNAAIGDQVKNTSANVVHLATHGQFSSRLEDTFLLTWDGQVNVKELSELLRSRDSASASKIDLLVLSACDTATGDDRAVLGLAGLAVKSGARSTLATLWPVKDKAASLLMRRFYDQLKKPGATKAEALRQAQINLIRETDFKEPFFWSAFVLVGNWQ